MQAVIHSETLKHSLPTRRKIQNNTLKFHVTRLASSLHRRACIMNHFAVQWRFFTVFVKKYIQSEESIHDFSY